MAIRKLRRAKTPEREIAQNRLDDALLMVGTAGAISALNNACLALRAQAATNRVHAQTHHLETQAEHGTAEAAHCALVGHDVPADELRHWCDSEQCTLEAASLPAVVSAVVLGGEVPLEAMFEAGATEATCNAS